MLISVRLFAGVRERAGNEVVEVEVPDSATTDDVLKALADVVGEARCVVAVNKEYVGPGMPVRPGDEVAIVPPISGGAQAFAHLGPEPIDLGDLVQRVGDPGAGGIATFLGVTREVGELEYEAYDEMALAKLTQLAEAILARDHVFGVAVAHRTGTVPLGEASVGIAVAGAHRDQAFDGARDLIDLLKEQVPIWKVEVDGTDRRRVDGTLPSA
jgi:molybdopterin synthase catalytic subunit